MLLVLAPLKIELTHLLEFFHSKGLIPEALNIGSREGYLLKNSNIFFAVGGHGKVEMALTAQHLVHHLPKVSGILCVGAAGSLTESVKPGEIVVATQTIEHDYNLKFVKRPLPEFKGDALLLARAQTAARATTGIHFGPIASGDEDVMDSERQKAIHQSTQGLAVAWEGAGSARASARHRLPFLEMRVITDSADVHAAHDFSLQIESGMKRLAAFLHTWMQTN